MIHDRSAAQADVLVGAVALYELLMVVAGAGLTVAAAILAVGAQRRGAAGRPLQVVRTVAGRCGVDDL